MHLDYNRTCRFDRLVVLAPSQSQYLPGWKEGIITIPQYMDVRQGGSSALHRPAYMRRELAVVEGQISFP